LAVFQEHHFAMKSSPGARSLEPVPGAGRSIAVAGGGIGGVAAALALCRAGWAVKVYERSRQFGEVGAGMSLWPNATRVLQTWGVLDAVIKRGQPATRFNLHRPDGNLISSISMAGFPTPALCIHRADLHQALREPLPPGCLATDRRLEGFSHDADGVTARFSGGVEARADGLIGADGIKSMVRSQLHGATEPIYRGYCIWRGIAPEIKGAIPGHISETWGRGRRFGILPMGQGKTCWYATLNGPLVGSVAANGHKAEITKLFAHWHQPIAALIEATEPGNIIKNYACDRKPLKGWGEGRVTLLGDAAHPITPNVGQGACMAIEDAACLAKCLQSGMDLGAAFRRYEALREPRTSYVARQARRIGMIGQWDNPWLVQARDWVTRLVLAHTSDMRRNIIYAHEI
jgi:2-polyprenyl-6-methoxyphenol hydroxylase-like FAD-dependent oxidoreductase